MKMSQIPAQELNGTTAGSQNLVPCRICGRQFAPDVLMRHEPICKKVFNKKRKPFNSFKQRLQGTDIGTVKRQPPLKNQPVKKSNWRQHHADFINAIQSAKQVTKAMQEGRPLPPPPPPSINPDYIQCPFCLRRFNEAAAAKHIKFCEEQAARRAIAAKITKQPMGKQPVTQRKKPTVTPLLPHEKRVQKVDNAEKSTPETPPGTLQKSRRPLGISPGKKSAAEFGQQTQTRR
ncbi:zinc finger C2HC domain-containing protein 1B [Gallus gallus]|uniref:zinc finger C2HC domain-containing protein 1B n=1 Tax=Gallus gallus TaxID=9031 RepID=UPI0000447D79|nr:zinc finger C2HC domain-containing protein 1B [Gallus gallus]|eukprot:XP_419704.3 zinc finger C2HC domain-containing protein 1B [Gallus gallus]